MSKMLWTMALGTALGFGISNTANADVQNSPFVVKTQRAKPARLGDSFVRGQTAVGNFIGLQAPRDLPLDLIDLIDLKIPDPPPVTRGERRAGDETK